MTKKRSFLLFALVISLLVFTIEGFTRTKTQQISLIDREVKRINSLILNGADKSEDPLSKKDPDVDEHATIYLDAKYRIRKVMIKGNGPDDQWSSTLYFKTNGSLCYISFSTRGMGGYRGEVSFSGTVYYQKRKAIKIDTLEYNVRNRKVYKKNVLTKYQVP